jgi:nucleotide-binding universal stress UspA family protein
MRKLEIRSILVATDLLESSVAVVASAHALADRTGAELHVITSLEIPDMPYPGAGSTLEFQRQIHSARNTLHDQVARALPEGSAATTQKVAIESATQAIMERAAEVAADLIVIGPHRPRAFRGHILGNTADRLLRSANVPVLIVADPLPLPLTRVVAPIDLSDPARGALDQAFLWAGALGRNDFDSGMPAVDLRVIHVIPRMYEDYDIPFDRAVIGPQLHTELEKAQRRVGSSTQVSVREEALWGNAPSEEIIRYATDEDADLVVMGTHGYGALGRALIGSVTSRVARAAPCAMLLVPPPLWAVTDEKEESAKAESASPVARVPERS